MDLDTFMKMKKFTNESLGKQLGVGHTSIRLYRLKMRNPTIDVARKLMILSKGLITLEELIREEDL